ncbi:hypothetical protein HK100_005353, partial [Physocladia obscura]
YKMLSSFKLPIALLLAASVSAAPTPENGAALSQNSACTPSSSIATFLGFAGQLQQLQTSSSSQSTMRQIAALQDLNSLSGLATRITQLQKIVDTISMDISESSMASSYVQVITSQILALQGFRAVLAAQVSELQKSAAEITETTEKNAIMTQIDVLQFGVDANDGLTKRYWHGDDYDNNDYWGKRDAAKTGENNLERKDRNGGGDWRGEGRNDGHGGWNHGNNWDRNNGGGWEGHRGHRWDERW